MAATRKRSPSYPAIPLREALERARTFYEQEDKHETVVETATSHWGYKPKSSGGKQTVAALKAYGLMQDEGSGGARKVRLSDFGLAIVQDERIESPERDQRIKEAALKPRIMRDMWDRYGPSLPSFDTVKHYLAVDRDFNPNSVDDFVKIYKDNIEFARLTREDTVEGSDEPDNQEDDVNYAQTYSIRKPEPPSARASYEGEEIANIRVSRNSTIRLIATGPYSRKSIEALVQQLNLGLQLGTYDDIEDGEEAEH